MGAPRSGAPPTASRSASRSRGRHRPCAAGCSWNTGARGVRTASAMRGCRQVSGMSSDDEADATAFASSSSGGQIGGRAGRSPCSRSGRARECLGSSEGRRTGSSRRSTSIRGHSAAEPRSGSNQTTADSSWSAPTGGEIRAARNGAVRLRPRSPPPFPRRRGRAPTWGVTDSPATSSRSPMDTTSGDLTTIRRRPWPGATSEVRSRSSTTGEDRASRWTSRRPNTRFGSITA